MAQPNTKIIVFRQELLNYQAQVASLLQGKASVAQVSAKADAVNVYDRTQVDGLIASATQGKANASAVYTKAEADALVAARALATAVYTKAEADAKFTAGSSTARLWNATTKSWPAIGSSALPVTFYSTNDPNATAPTEARVNFDVWIPHADSTVA
jgi:hypothetical protein